MTSSKHEASCLIGRALDGAERGQRRLQCGQQLNTSANDRLQANGQLQGERPGMEQSMVGGDFSGRTAAKHIDKQLAASMRPAAGGKGLGWRRAGPEKTSVEDSS